MKHAFAFSVSGINILDDYEDRLCRAGCGDALVAVIGGKVYLDFNRESISFDAAVRSAQQDVERAGGQVDYVLPPRGKIRRGADPRVVPQVLLWPRMSTR